MISAREKLSTFKDLPDDWDSYGAAPINSRAIRVAHCILRMLFPWRKQVEAFPVPDGGVQVELFRLEIHVKPQGWITFFLAPK